MKLIIDINENVYTRLFDNGRPMDIADGIVMERAIRNGIPLEQIRDEIEKVFCMSVVTNELRTPMEVKTEILQVIDK